MAGRMQAAAEQGQFLVIPSSPANSRQAGADRSQRWFWGLLAGILLLSYPLFLHHLGQRDMWSSHEGRAAQNAARMLEDGDWWLPRLFDGRVEMQKPPLYYWLVALVGWGQGEVDGTAVRLPAALGAMGCLLLVFLAFAQQVRIWAGAWAALILATIVRFTWLARVGRIDMLLTCAVTLTLLGYWMGHQSERQGMRVRGWCWRGCGFLGMAAALLLKGPIGFVLPAVVVVATLVVETGWLRRQTLRDWGRSVQSAWWGMPLVLALVLPWFVYANDATEGAFFREFVLRHNWQRGLGGDEQLDSHDHPAWYYLVQWPLDAMPWSLLLVAIGVVAWRRRLWPSDSLAQWGLLWFLSMFVFLSLMRYKRPEYLLPALPGLALFMGGWMQELGSNCSAQCLKWLRLCSFLGIGLYAVGWLFYVDHVLPQQESRREWHRFAKAVREWAPSPRMVILFRVDAHALNFHLGRPTERLWEWENLDVWAVQPEPVYVIMPEEWARVWERHMEAGQLYPVITTSQIAGEQHERPLTLFRTQPLE